MTTQYTCDGCGVPVDDRVFLIQVFVQDEEGNGDPFEGGCDIDRRLCPKCLRTLIAVMDPGNWRPGGLSQDDLNVLQGLPTSDGRNPDGEQTTEVS